tara:strand:+ start:2446 stop:2676 length:231 start_codon:yes stop_codon:yes gene_type:complete
MENKENEEDVTQYLIEVVNNESGQSAVFGTDSKSFPEAMADAYVQRHNISKATGDDWKIVSVLDKTYFTEKNRRLP